MSPYTALKIRFGILAARHSLERHRLTEWQIDYIEGCADVGWLVGDCGTIKAHDREYAAAWMRRGHG